MFLNKPSLLPFACRRASPDWFVPVGYPSKLNYLNLGGLAAPAQIGTSKWFRWLQMLIFSEIKHISPCDWKVWIQKFYSTQFSCLTFTSPSVPASARHTQVAACQVCKWGSFCYIFVSQEGKKGRPRHLQGFNWKSRKDNPERQFMQINGLETRVSRDESSTNTMVFHADIRKSKATWRSMTDHFQVQVYT